MNQYVVLVAGGIGMRMQSAVPKQFLEFNGKSILHHSIERFYNYNNAINIILVLGKESHSHWNSLIQKNPLPCKVTLATGGQERSDSTRAGLEFVPDNSIVAIHDAVRPLLSNSLLDRCFKAAEKYGNACPCIPLSDSLRMKENDHTLSVDRSLYYQVQTPQCFKADLLKSAFEKTKRNTFTDEISLFEDAGHEIHIVEGERWNIKITYPQDLQVAEALSGKL